jgi:hypothetical protein
MPVLAGMEAGIEATGPRPLIDVDWHTCSFADGANMNVAVVDVPGLMVRIVGAAAGEGGHSMIPQIRIIQKPLRIGHVDG